MASKRLKKGIFITFEGPEGSGKSLHSRRLYSYLKRKGYPCVYTREPGGTRLGERVRRLLLSAQTGISIGGLSELFLFEACRAQFVEEIVAPALKKKKIVISDRFSDATMAYQGYGGGLPLAMIRTVDAIAARRLVPGVTILLDIDTRTGLKRATQKTIDRIESKTLRYHRRVRSGYRKLAKAHPRRFTVIRVQKEINDTQALVRRAVKRALQKIRQMRQ